jgi:hypothetical protein
MHMNNHDAEPLHDAAVSASSVQLHHAVRCAPCSSQETCHCQSTVLTVYAVHGLRDGVGGDCA